MCYPFAPRRHQRLLHGGHVDRDPDAVAGLIANTTDIVSLRKITARSFAHVRDAVAEFEDRQFDGILYDLGLSTDQLDEPGELLVRFGEPAERVVEIEQLLVDAARRGDLARCRALVKADPAAAPDAPKGGLTQMVGDVWEWTRSLWGEDWHRPDFRYPYEPADGREDESAGNRVSRVVRRGAFVNVPRLVRCAARGRVNPHLENKYIGFRVCVVPQKD